jgi:hypothetical protein
MELGNYATYPLRGLGSISFWTPSTGVLELNDVLFVLGLKKNILLVYCMVELHCVIKFDDQKVIIRC